VIDRELHLDAVDALATPEGEASRVVHQHVEPPHIVAQTRGKSAYVRLGRKVGDLEAHLGIRHRRRDAGRGVGAAGGIPAHADHPRAGRCQLVSDLEPDARCGARHHAPLAGRVVHARLDARGGAITSSRAFRRPWKRARLRPSMD
jgi:hypothetical protein